MILIFAATAVATASPSPAPDPCGGAQSNLFATLDRPSVGFSPCAVKTNERIFELGYANASGPAGRSAAYPQAFLRFGAAPNLEIDVIGPSYALEQTSGMGAAGFQDSGLGAKYELWHHGGSAMGMDFLYALPTGAAAFTAGAPVQTVNLDYTAPISSIFSVSSTLGVENGFAASRGGTSGRFSSALPSALLTDQWNPRAQAFVEVFGQTRTRPDGGSLFGVDANLQYLLAPYLEIDVGGGHRVTDVDRSRYVGFGFGVRF